MTSTSDLADHFLRACEEAAIAAARWRGRGERKKADGAAVEAMRAVFDSVPFDGRVAIGEGERDDAPMLYIGEPLGSMQGVAGAAQIDIAVDPLECTNHCALDLPNAIAVLAAAPRGTLLHAPDCYMDKIAGGPELYGQLSLEADLRDRSAPGGAAELRVLRAVRLPDRVPDERRHGHARLGHAPPAGARHDQADREGLPRRRQDFGSSG